MTEPNRITRKYGMILCRPGDQVEDDLHFLAEIYTLRGETVFSKASITSPEELALAHRDVVRDGVNRWFYDNGLFEWRPCPASGEFRWHWEKTTATE